MLQRQHWTFHVSQSNDALAFSVPSSIVVISERMLGLLHTDDQLAFILAHEIGHLIARHAGESMTRCAPATWRDVAMKVAQTEDERLDAVGGPVGCGCSSTDVQSAQTALRCCLR
jgi:predicted Zn-dependent protease